MKTYSAKPQDITRDWYVIDANDKVLGRLASGIAHRRGGVLALSCVRGGGLTERRGTYYDGRLW